MIEKNSNYLLKQFSNYKTVHIKVFLEDYSVTEQAQLFNRALEIVSPHGAGLTNLAFCEQGTKVVELFTPNYVLPLYWNFCNILDLDYYYLIGEGDRPQRGVDPHIKNEKIKVNMEDFKKVMSFSLTRIYGH